MTTIPNIPFPEGRIVAGIYAIVNTINGKLYIGSSKNIWKRWNSHKNLLRTNAHNNDLLWRAWCKHGEKSFEFRLVEEVDCQSQLLPREQHWLDLLQPFKRGNGYNIAAVAGHPNAGRRFEAKGKYKGICEDKRINKWYPSFVLPSGRQVNVATFDTPKEAAFYYDAVMRHYHSEEEGDLIYYNFPNESVSMSIEEVRQTRRQQVKNKTSSKYVGVFWNNESNRWAAFITLIKTGKHRAYRLGLYDTEEAAAKARDSVALHIFGDSAKTNFPDVKPRSMEEVKRAANTQRQYYTEFRGVQFHKRCKKWRAAFTHKGKYYYWGNFGTPEEAAVAYDWGNIQIRGKDAHLNFPHLRLIYLESESINQILQKGIQLQLDLGL